MTYRLDILRQHKLGLPDIQKVIGDGPMAGARTSSTPCATPTRSSSFRHLLRIREAAHAAAGPADPVLPFPGGRRAGHAGRYHLRMPNQKQEAVSASRNSISRWSPPATYNDTAMLGEAHGGILFHPPENVIREFPQYPVVLNYTGLRREIDKVRSGFDRRKREPDLPFPPPIWPHHAP